MSDEVTSLLDRATPSDVDDVDYSRLARSGRRRRWAKRATGGVVGVVVMAASVIAVDGIRPPAIEVLAEPGAPTTAEPIGTWEVVLDELPTGGNEAYAAATSDGRLVVYGGKEGIDGAGADGGAVIDPATGATTAIPRPPTATRSFPGIQLADDRLLVFGGNDGSPMGAWYDIDQGRWTVIPAAPTGDVAPAVRAWDGTTLVVGDTFRMTNVEGQNEGNLELWRWQVGDENWTAVPRSPVDAGRVESAAADGRLAVWTNPSLQELPDGLGGRGPAPDAERRDSRLAVLDISANTWQTVPRDELPDLGVTNEATVGWLDGRVVVVPVPAFLTGNVSGPDVELEQVELAPPAALDLASGTWEPLQELPESLQRTQTRVNTPDGSAPNNGSAPTTGVLQAGIRRGARAALLPDGTWTDPVSADSIHQVDGALIALQGHVGGEESLGGAVWTGSEWEPIRAPDVEGPRWDAAVTSSADHLYVIGGWSQRLGIDFLHQSHREVLRFTP